MRIIVGAGNTAYPGWLSLRKRDLDITDRQSWERLFPRDSLDAILCEHVLEHLTEDESERAINNFFCYLRRDGYCRIAVPDGYNPSENYINFVKPGNWWNKEDHRQLFNVDTLGLLLQREGFKVEPIEGYTKNGWFSNPDFRSARVLRRPGELWNVLQCLVSLSAYNSLIVDGIKP